MNKLTTIAAFILAASAAAGSFAQGDPASPTVKPSESAAKSTFEKSHPRRAPVNERLESPHRRINRELREGELTKKQAKALNKNDRQIGAEERAMASQNGGHITAQEQKVLNQQENAVGRQIGTQSEPIEKAVWVGRSSKRVAR